MTPIDFIGLKNFRVFNEEGIFEKFTSINVLTGSNNSGKSSIIKSLQMLKNSISVNKIPFDLDLTEQEHLLGDFDNILNNKKNRNIEIALPFTFLGATSTYCTLLYTVPEEKICYKAHLRKIVIADKEDGDTILSFTYREATVAEKNQNVKQYAKELALYHQKQNIKVSKTTEEAFLDSFNIPPHYSPIVAYIDWSINIEKIRNYLSVLLDLYEHYLDNRNGKDYLEWRNNVLEEQSVIPSFLIKYLKSDSQIEIDKLLASWKSFLSNEIKSGTQLSGKEAIFEDDFEAEDYLFPRPEIEEILYYYSKKILNKNLTWKNNNNLHDSYFVISDCFQSSYEKLIWRVSTINYLSTIKEQNSRVYTSTINSPFTNLLKDFSNPNVDRKFINQYLKDFEIGNAINVNFEPKYQMINVSITSSKSPERDLVDFGYGIKQLILILMQIAVLAYKNMRTKEVYDQRGEPGYEDYYIPSLLLIEEPETNLHPKWQSLLAKMFFEANSKFNIQLVIETHSEYLIRKFQTLTAEGELSSKDIKIFYLRGADKVEPNRKQLETILIEADGSIDYEMFDGGFFDQNDTLELSLLNIRRRNFLSDLQALKENKEQNEDIISALQIKIDEYTLKADMSVYRLMVTTLFNPATKLHAESIIYLTSGQYLLNNIGQNEDFSPVIIQYGRAIEHELCSLFKNIHPTKWWKFAVMQGSLEKYKFSSSLMGTCSNIEFALLLTELNALFNTPGDLKIELLQDLRDQRNDAAHPGSLKTKAQAEAYINNADQFLIKWIQLKK